MSTTVIVTGGSSGIGDAVCRHAPAGARVVAISRSRADSATEHIRADLANPANWARIGAQIAGLVQSEDVGRTAFIHAAATISPIAFADRVGREDYAGSVLLNSAVPQILGQSYIGAVASRPGRHQLCLLSSGAATSVYAGWSHYCAGKAATDHWVRCVGVEQRQRGGVEVCSVSPGVVDTRMQDRIRSTARVDFPQVDKFVELHNAGRLRSADEIALQLWTLLDDGFESGTVIDLRVPPEAPA